MLSSLLSVLVITEQWQGTRLHINVMLRNDFNLSIPHNSEKGNKAALKNCVHEININNQQLQDSSVDASLFQILVFILPSGCYLYSLTLAASHFCGWRTWFSHSDSHLLNFIGTEMVFACVSVQMENSDEPFKLFIVQQGDSSFYWIIL